MQHLTIFQFEYSLLLAFTNWLEVGVFHSVLGSDSLGMVVAKHIIQQVEGFFSHEGFVLVVHKLVPRLLGVLAEDVVIMGVEGDIVLFHVAIQIVSAKHFCDLDELVVVVFALEKGLFLKDHASKHAAKRPNVERVVVRLQVNQQLRAFEVS